MLFGISVLPVWVKPALYAIVLAVAFSAGWYVQGLRWSKAEAKWKAAAQEQTIKDQQHNLDTSTEVLNADATQAAKDAARIEELEKRINEIISKASDNACLSSDTVERLRQFWDR